MTLIDDLAVNGGDITSTATTFNLLTSPTTMNVGTGASAALTIGHASAVATINGGVNVPTGKVYKVNSVQVVGAQGAAIADATDDPSDISDKLNYLLARVRAHGLIAT
jgi:hypothetical protein